MNNFIRAFIAIKLPDGIVTAIAKAQGTLASANADVHPVRNFSSGSHIRNPKESSAIHVISNGVKWVAPQNIHITLKFLGNIDEAALERLADVIAPAVASFKTFDIEAYGMGSFPERGAPRVVWVGCRGDVAALKAIATFVEQCSRAIGVAEEEREFSAHITIGRVRSNKNVAYLRERIAAFSQTSFGSQTVAGFTLFKSDLRSGGPVYTALREFRLGTK